MGGGGGLVRRLSNRWMHCCQRDVQSLFSGVMITVESISEVAQDQTLTIELPKSVTPGPHRVVVVIEETPFGLARRQPAGPLSLTKLRLAAWPKDCTFRREDISGDSGR